MLAVKRILYTHVSVPATPRRVGLDQHAHRTTGFGTPDSTLICSWLQLLPFLFLYTREKTLLNLAADIQSLANPDSHDAVPGFFLSPTRELGPLLGSRM